MLPAGIAGADDVELLGDEEGEDVDSNMGPETQIITTGCWLTMKEAALVLGKVADHAPKQGADSLSLWITILVQGGPRNQAKLPWECSDRTRSSDGIAFVQHKKPDCCNRG